MVAAVAFAFITGKKVAGVHDHAAGADLKIAAEAKDRAVKGFDGERNVAFGGTLPELYDSGDKTFVSCELDGTQVKGYDRKSSSFYEARVDQGVVQVYDHEHGAWFAYDIQDAAAQHSFHRE
jgi:hypothetical protein